MEYRLLGNSGCAVSALALGTLTFGNETDEAGSFAQFDRFTEFGGSLIDTADVYADGRSEEIIGRWLTRPAVTSVILGARTLDQLNDNLAAADLSLSDDEMHLLDDASEPDTPDYPYGEKDQMQRSRRIRGGCF